MRADETIERVLRRRFRLDVLRRGQASPVPRVPPVVVSVEWYEAVRGVAMPTEFAEPVPCTECEGRGYERRPLTEICKRCDGSGHVSPPSLEPDEERVLDVTACLACEGRGRGGRRPCTACSGTGAVVVPRAVTVFVPAGASDGDELAVEGARRPILMRVGARPRDSVLVLGTAGLALLCAVALLVYLLLR